MRILLLIGSVATLALAAIPTIAVGAMPASFGVETPIDTNRTFSPEKAVNTQGFAAPERRDLPGFEVVQNAAAPLPGSVAPTRSLSGRYAMLSRDGKDTGCMLMLAAPASGSPCEGRGGLSGTVWISGR